MRPQQRPNRWNNFFALHWYDTLIEAIFKLAARSSEVLLAIGVILATANHIQHGELFTTPSLDAHGQPIRLEDGSLHMTETALFGFWTWTQAIGFEASSGVVLVAALEARRRGDTVKRNILLSLVVGLSLVGTTMLIMAFVENVTGIKERELPAYYGITMGVLRSLVSVAYIMIGRIKHLRFSGPEDPLERTPNALTQLATVGQQIERIEANTQHRLTELTERLNLLTEHNRTFGVNGPKSHRTGTEQSPNILTKDRTGTEQSPNTLKENRIDTEYIDEEPNLWSERTEHLTEYIEGEPNKYRIATEQSPNTLKEDRIDTEKSPNTTEQSPNTLKEDRTLGDDGPDEEKEPGKSEIKTPKARFVENCLTRWPGISNKEISQKAARRDMYISPSHISERRKAFQSATRPDPPMEDKQG